ncbi:hypothetical protein HDU67_000960 [Dinochytrium kinnereticum]|nr:hypothetical protein HDU67_000960 [Dinochytrium kinnereticum]
MYSASHLRDKYLLLMSLPITLINLAILTTWQILDPLQPIRVENASTARFHYECQSNSPTLQRSFTLTLMIYNTLLLLLAMLLAYATRNAANAYRETLYILYAAQNVFLCGVVVVAIVFSGGTGYTASLALRVAMTLFATCFVWAVLVGRVALVTGRAVNLGFQEGLENGSSSSGIPSGIISGTSDAGSDTFIIPVKDGVKTFEMWERRKVIYSTSSRLLAIVHIESNTGDTILLTPTTTLSPSPHQDCLEIRNPTAFFKILQFGNARSLEKCGEITQPALKGGSGVVSSVVLGDGGGGGGQGGGSWGTVYPPGNLRGGGGRVGGGAVVGGRC